MKRLTYPYFQIGGLVDIHEAGSSNPITKMVAGGYIRTRDDVFSVLLRDAKWKLELLGVSKERIAALVFEDQEITGMVAVDSVGVRRVDNIRPDAFFDYPGIAKRGTLIRQRRLVPQDQRDMLEIYGPKTVPTVENTQGAPS